MLQRQRGDQRRQLGVVRELWQTRDRIAQRRDVSPGKVLSDAAIVEAALSMPANAHAAISIAARIRPENSRVRSGCGHPDIPNKTPLAIAMIANARMVKPRERVIACSNQSEKAMWRPTGSPA